MNNIIVFNKFEAKIIKPKIVNITEISNFDSLEKKYEVEIQNDYKYRKTNLNLNSKMNILENDEFVIADHKNKTSINNFFQIARKGLIGKKKDADKQLKQIDEETIVLWLVN